MRQVNNVILRAADNASQNSAVIDANQLINASFQAIFDDAGPTGTFKIQASLDVSAVGNPFTPTNWIDIAGASASITLGSAALISINNMSYRWLRAVWTRASGGAADKNITVTLFAIGV